MKSLISTAIIILLIRAAFISGVGSSMVQDSFSTSQSFSAQLIDEVVTVRQP